MVLILIDNFSPSNSHIVQYNLFIWSDSENWDINPLLPISGAYTKHTNPYLELVLL